MKRISSKKGSALLIVLGMLAFMVVSAVAFSMFMRQSRLPSSFLVQQIASSHLVKAALAEAMARIDMAIGDGQYSGVGGSPANTWEDRVFTEGGGGVNNTVTTMPLEGLAYLPAPLIDPVRYWSRHTKTATWESLDYDAGHYAFTAINVSDYLDINRLQSWTMRDSSPSNRVSMAYLFSGDDHDSFNIKDAKEFDEFVNSGRPEPQGASARFVSLADFNLAMFSKCGEDGLAGFSNPFFEYLNKGSDDGTISGGQLGKKVIDQTFITDSWYPTITNTTNNKVYYLTEDRGQPFDRKAMEPGSDINTFAAKQMSGRYNDHFRLNFAEGLALKDYLDEDNSVTLLSYPTIERTPMLTGLQVGQRVDEQAKLVLKGYSTPVNEKETVETWKFGGLDKDLQIHYDASAVFPFRRSSALQDSGKYQFQLLVKVFFSSAEDADKFTKVRIRNNFQPTDAEWNNISSTLAYDNNKGYWYACSEKKSLDDNVIKEGVQEEKDALLDIKGPHTMEIKFPGKEWSVYAIKYMNEAPESYEPYSDGVVNQDPLQYYISDKDELKLVNAKQFVDNKRISLCLHYYVWARIIGKDEKIGKDVVVDMFPATAEDSPIIGEKMLDDLCGAVEEPSMKPVVPIVGPSVTMENDDFKPDGKLERKASLTPTQSTAGQLAIYCNDPRFNWAPEDWFSPGSEITKGGWLDITLENRRAKGVNDIFQFVSNQGYLQSMGELQFIPYIDSSKSRGKEDGLSFSGAYFENKQKYNGDPFDKRTTPKDLANDNYMWHTRWLCGQGRDLDDDVDNPYDWGIEDARDGASVSYYAEPHMLLPALANTPYDWIIASTNLNAKTIGNELDEGSEYCFNSDSPEAPLKWKDLMTIAKCISAEMKDSTGNPENAFATCRDWSDKDDFFDVKGLNLSDVDRKFLFSYWRSCFSNKQQLFLIFVRAEPTIMTGMTGGRTPSQLGARAVALVWREPVCSIETSGSSEEGAAAKPHRMRILFYHQFN